MRREKLSCFSGGTVEVVLDAEGKGEDVLIAEEWVKLSSLLGDG